MKSRHRKSARFSPVDHRYIAELCARHASGDYVLAANRFCEAKQLSALDKIRIKRLAEQQSAIRAAVESATMGR